MGGCSEVSSAAKSASAIGTLVDLDPLRVGNEVRLGHEPDLVAGLLQDRGEHGADRSLAVGAGDQDPLEKRFRIPQLGKEGARALEAELDAEAAQRGQVGERFLVGHGAERCWR